MKVGGLVGPCRCCAGSKCFVASRALYLLEAVLVFALCYLHSRPWPMCHNVLLCPTSTATPSSDQLILCIGLRCVSMVAHSNRPSAV